MPVGACAASFRPSPSYRRGNSDWSNTGSEATVTQRLAVDQAAASARAAARTSVD